jgi:putative membrane protein
LKHSLPFSIARLSTTAALVALHAAPAAAHGGAGDGHPAWPAWNGSAHLLISLALLGLLYAEGLTRLWRAAGVGRGVSRGGAGAFGAGLLVLVLALVSPLDGLADQLQTAHMIQHMLLMMVAAPLLVVGSGPLVLLWALPRRFRKGVLALGRRLDPRRASRYWLWHPLLLWGLFAGTLWVWHIPTLYEAALRLPLLHDFQHLGFVVTACLFWRVLLDPLSRLRLNRGVGVIYLFTTSLHATVLGVFMALTPHVWYPHYTQRASTWGLSALEDQQLAGLIMWMPACMIYAAVAAVIFALWLREPEALPDARIPTG